MTRQEAFKVSRETKAKITHEYFTHEEWAIVTGNVMTFEDGHGCFIEDFLKWRNNDPVFDDNWSLFKDN